MGTIVVKTVGTIVEKLCDELVGNISFYVKTKKKGFIHVLTIL